MSRQQAFGAANATNAVLLIASAAVSAVLRERLAPLFSPPRKTGLAYSGTVLPERRGCDGFTARFRRARQTISPATKTIPANVPNPAAMPILALDPVEDDAIVQLPMETSPCVVGCAPLGQL